MIAQNFYFFIVPAEETTPGMIVPAPCDPRRYKQMHRCASLAEVDELASHLGERAPWPCVVWLAKEDTNQRDPRGFKALRDKVANRFHRPGGLHVNGSVQPAPVESSPTSHLFPRSQDGIPGKTCIQDGCTGFVPHNQGSDYCDACIKADQG